jgi:predicted NUDIX family NTP pyrophosphohydrolase
MAMPKESDGILVYRKRNDILQVFLVHPGGPFWRKKDLGAWSIPKGEPGPEEDPLSVARREFQEETGFGVSGNFIPLSPVRQPGGKVVQAWALESDCDPEAIRSNTFKMEWPPRSGRQQEYPEVDRAAWFGIEEAKSKINQGQISLLEELERIVQRS